METFLQGPINSSFHEDYSLGAAGFLNNTESVPFVVGEEAEASLDGNMPFLQMLLHSVDAPPFFPLSEPNFQSLLRLQRLKNRPWDENENEKQIQGLELESCVTQDVTEEKHSSARPSQPPRERRKRKRQRAAKNKEEVESQRMTHIAVERNRRRQMNFHLNSLRSLMPASYIQRGDQASIVGGAIDFVKELEQLLYSLENQKRTRLGDEAMTSKPQSEETGVTTPPSTAGIEVAVIEEHVNLKVECKRRSGQLARAIVGLEEELRFAVLHLNITASPSQHTVLYSFNLKMEEECGVRSAEEIALAVQQMLSVVNDN